MNTLDIATKKCLELMTTHTHELTDNFGYSHNHISLNNYQNNVFPDRLNQSNNCVVGNHKYLIDIYTTHVVFNYMSGVSCVINVPEMNSTDDVESYCFQQSTAIDLPVIYSAFSDVMYIVLVLQQFKRESCNDSNTIL